MLKSITNYLFASQFNNGKLINLRQLKRKMHKRYDDKNGFAQNQNNNVMNQFRKWRSVNTVRDPGFVFSVFNYNILSQQLLEQHSYLYKDHQPHALNWKIRLNNLIGEIRSANPEILCCQVSLLTFDFLMARLDCVNVIANGLEMCVF